MRRPRALIIGLLAAAALALPAAASATIYDVAATATISGHGVHTKVHLRIDLNGQNLLSQVVRSRACGPGCMTTPLGGSRSPIRVVELVPNTAPEVVLGLYSGGAHCCFIDEVYSLDPGTMTFRRTERNFLDAGAKITDLAHNGRYEFESADARIEEAGFTDFADSGAPIQIFTFTGSRFKDVTDSYPALIKTDAAKWWRAFRHDRGNGRGLIAAWAADEDRLGNFREVRSRLATAVARHELDAPAGLSRPVAATFVQRLQGLLHRLRYTR